MRILFSHLPRYATGAFLLFALHMPVANAQDYATSANPLAFGRSQTIIDSPQVPHLPVLWSVIQSHMRRPRRVGFGAFCVRPLTPPAPQPPSGARHPAHGPVLPWPSPNQRAVSGGRKTPPEAE